MTWNVKLWRTWSSEETLLMINILELRAICPFQGWASHVQGHLTGSSVGQCHSGDINQPSRRHQKQHIRQCTSQAWKIGRWTSSAIEVWIAENCLFTQRSFNLSVTSGARWKWTSRLNNKLNRFIPRARDPWAFAVDALVQWNLFNLICHFPF